MTDESQNISAKTWTRAADSISKVGYMDGASDGQAAAFQSSFDTGYKLGLEFGLQLGTKEALNSIHQKTQSPLTDPRKINCQICLNNISPQESVENLFNKQRDKNNEYMIDSTLEIN